MKAKRHGMEKTNRDLVDIAWGSLSSLRASEGDPTTFRKTSLGAYDNAILPSSTEKTEFVKQWKVLGKRAGGAVLGGYPQKRPDNHDIRRAIGAVPRVQQAESGGQRKPAGGYHTRPEPVWDWQTKRSTLVKSP